MRENFSLNVLTNLPETFPEDNHCVLRQMLYVKQVGIKFSFTLKLLEANDLDLKTVRY